ncbi:enoyl-CoA hydratase [Frankia sp. EI5c]|uniref:enoyl-CoA hydratase-related protein n=1 Tax=Frankia sp. EI5c TaxID=683316 RepID=UPI0007C3CB66|nr:enoyl-CoA hydratase-related protein [Frankia sp. EI5c]OAA25857.1 enoyl-CoA hydratase [Frankia sp. EI5c]
MRPEHVEYDVVDDHIGVIAFRRPRAVDTHGAHHAQLLRELDDAWRTAAEDSRVRVVVLRSAGRHFFARPDGSGGGEIRHQRHYARAWRDIPKPAVAAVQGRCLAGGVLLCSPCEHVVAADDAEFSHPGPGAEILDGAGRHAAAGRTLTAAEAQALGLVTTVVPLAALHRTALTLARGLGLGGAA